MKAVRLNELGGPEKLHVEEIPAPKPAAGEILVNISRAAFNRRDVFITQGLYPGIELPKTLGSDACGTVAELGAGASGPKAGTRVVIYPAMKWGADERVWKRDSGVLGMPHEGTFAEYVAVPAENVYPAPSSLTDDEAAAIPLAGLTAYRACFYRGRMTKDDVVLITGVGGGVQTFVLLFAKHVGAKAIVTSGSDEKLARAKAMGADVCINYKTSENWSKEARDAAGGGGPSLVIDSAGGETLSKSLDIARYGGRVVIYGGTLGDAKVRPFSLFWKQLDLMGTSMGSPQDFKEMLALFEGGLRPAVDEVVPMEQAAAAAERVLRNEQFGKVVLEIG